MHYRLNTGSHHTDHSRARPRAVKQNRNCAQDHMLNSARFSADGPQRRLRRITCFAIDLLKTCVARLRKHVTSVCRTTVCAVLVTPSYKACHGQSLPICNMSNNAKHQADTGELRHAKRRGRPGVCNEHLAIGGAARLGVGLFGSALRTLRRGVQRSGGGCRRESDPALAATCQGQKSCAPSN